MQLVIHVLLGYRELRDAAHYQDDPLVQRVLGLSSPTAIRLIRMASLSREDGGTVESIPQS